MDEREDDWNMEDPNDPPFSHVGGKRKYTAKKMEFVGWGSRQLIEFLTSLGKDTSKQISQHDVTSIITEYVNNNGLYHPQKKKKIACDEKLYSLFGKKMLARIKVNDLLEPHYAENEEDWDDFFSSSDENGEGSSVRYKSSHQLNTRSLETPKSCFASIVPSNIKLVYLKKGLIEELLKNPKTFEGKVVGSFVRIKMNPKDKYANYSYQLQQVIGVKMGSGLGDAVAETLLEVPTDMKEVRLSMLSGDNFSEEECKDLQERVKNGSIKKPTVVELQEKVQQLHEDITKHWIKRELSTLENLIDRANEKGWRKEFFEHLERRDLLMNESEQTRLLTEIPVVIAEELEVVVAPQVDRSPSPRLPESDEIDLNMEVNEAASTEIPIVIAEELEVVVAPQVERSPSPRLPGLDEIDLNMEVNEAAFTELPVVIAEELEVVVAPQVERSPSPRLPGLDEIDLNMEVNEAAFTELPVVIAEELEVVVAPQVERSPSPRLPRSDEIDLNMEVNEATSTEIPVVIAEELEVVVAPQVERSPSPRLRGLDEIDLNMEVNEAASTELPVVIAEELEVVVAPQVERSPSPRLPRSDEIDLNMEVNEAASTELPVVIAEELEVVVAPQVERSRSPRLPGSDEIDLNMEVNEAASTHEDSEEQNTKEQHANAESCQRQGNHVHPADTPKAASFNEEMDDTQYSAEPQHNFDYGVAAHSIDSGEPQHNNAVQTLPDNQTISISRNGENSGNATNVEIALHGPERELIVLSDDDDDVVVDNGTVQTEIDPPESPDFELWHYTDPQGVSRGPFSLQSLKRWYDFNYFPSDFMVWKTSLSRGEAVLLVHVLRRVFAPYRY